MEEGIKNAPDEGAFLELRPYNPLVLQADNLLAHFGLGV
jgi:hypothetical protein